MNRTIIAAIALLCLPIWQASAEPGASGYYAGAYAGYGQTHDAQLNIEGYPPGTLLFEPGYRLGLVGGYDFVSPLRLELDIGWRVASVEALEVPVLGEIAAAGETTALSGIVSLIYEPEMAGKLQPYIGAGLGAVRLALADAVIDVPGTGPVPVADDSITVPAWQIMGGISWPLSERTDLTAEYRLFGAISPEFAGVGGSKVDAEYTDSAVSLGLRFGL